jgi:hypothetical protein
MTIKHMIGFSILTVFALGKGFLPAAPSETVSAAAATGSAAVKPSAAKPSAAKPSAEIKPSPTGMTPASIAATVAAIGKHTGGNNGGHGGNGHDRPDFHPPESSEVQSQISDLREATARFHRLEVAIQEGYAPFGGCFSNPPEGNMGYHYANAELMEDPAVDPNHPELLLYEKQEDGSMRLVGVEYLTFQAAWHKAGNRFLPKLFGERFHLNSTLLDEPFYLLHVWQWKHNPSGRFEDWNPRVVCR